MELVGFGRRRFGQSDQLLHQRVGGRLVQMRKKSLKKQNQFGLMIQYIEQYWLDRYIILTDRTNFEILTIIIMSIIEWS